MKFLKVAFAAASISLTMLAGCKKNEVQQVSGKPDALLLPATNKSTLTATNYVPGQHYYYRVADTASTSSFVAVEYIAGDANSKLILIAPHGGTTRPAFMRTRTETYSYGSMPADPYNNDTGFSDIPDSNTDDLAEEIADAITAQTSVRPHVIINHLHRAKLDGNRRVEVATQGNFYATNAWNAFHNYIEAAKATANVNGEVLVLDIHGNAHSPQRTELGYLISKNQFTTNYSSLGNLTASSSIRYMVKPGTVTMTSLIRGANSLGTLLMNYLPFKATPSTAYPEPGNTSVFTDGGYFDGGYNTSRHGSKNGGTISAIQLEFNADVRMNSTTRPGYAQSIAHAVADYMTVYF
jgi:hypothetical protein